MKYMNLLNNPVTVIRDDGETVVLPPSEHGTVYVEKTKPRLVTNLAGAPVLYREETGLVNMPDPMRRDTIYIVSALVANVAQRLGLYKDYVIVFPAARAADGARRLRATGKLLGVTRFYTLNDPEAEHESA